MSENYWEHTQSILQNPDHPLIKKPKLTEALLKRPPFRFLHDVIVATIRTCNFAQGLYSTDEMDSKNVTDKEAKLLFLRKIILVVELVTNQKITAKPAKIIAGLDALDTNLFLQVFGQATQISDGQIEAKKVLNELTRDAKSSNQNDSLTSRIEVPRKQDQNPQNSQGQNQQFNDEQIHENQILQNTDRNISSSNRKHRYTQESQQSPSQQVQQQQELAKIRNDFIQDISQSADNQNVQQNQSRGSARKKWFDGTQVNEDQQYLQQQYDQTIQANNDLDTQNQLQQNIFQQSDQNHVNKKQSQGQMDNQQQMIQDEIKVMDNKMQNKENNNQQIKLKNLADIMQERQEQQQLLRQQQQQQNKSNNYNPSQTIQLREDQAVNTLQRNNSQQEYNQNLEYIQQQQMILQQQQSLQQEAPLFQQASQSLKGYDSLGELSRPNSAFRRPMSAKKPPPRPSSKKQQRGPQQESFLPKQQSKRQLYNQEDEEQEIQIVYDNPIFQQIQEQSQLQQQKLQHTQILQNDLDKSKLELEVTITMGKLCNYLQEDIQSMNKEMNQYAIEQKISHEKLNIEIKKSQNQVQQQDQIIFDIGNQIYQCEQRKLGLKTQAKQNDVKIDRLLELICDSI